MTDLSEAPDLYEAPTTDEERKAFRVDVLGKAVWASRKLRDVTVLRRDTAAVVAAEVERAQAWGARRDEALARDAAFFERLLVDYALWVRDQSGDRQKSVTTPYATIKTRPSGGGWEVDQEAALAWAKTYRPDLVQVQEQFLLADAKRVFEATDSGEVIDPNTGAFIPGIKVKPSTLTAKVTVDLSGEVTV